MYYYLSMLCSILGITMFCFISSCFKLGCGPYQPITPYRHTNPLNTYKLIATVQQSTAIVSALQPPVKKTNVIIAKTKCSQTTPLKNHPPSKPQSSQNTNPLLYTPQTNFQNCVGTFYLHTHLKPLLPLTLKPLV